MRMMTLFASAALLCFPYQCPAADLDCNDQMVAQLVHAGIAPDLVLQKIEECEPHFALDPAHLLALKQAGVSDDLVRAMAHRQNGRGNLLSTRPEEFSEMGGIATMPDEVGVYWLMRAGELVRIEGLAVSNERTGSLLASAVTFHIKRARVNAQLRGSRARVRITDRQPQFYFYLPEDASIGDYLLLRLAQREDVRQIEIAEQTFWKVQQGVDHAKEVDFDYKRLKSRLYAVVPKGELASGEYGFYIASGVQLKKPTGRIYDFGID